MISYWCIGGASSDQKTRHIGWSIPQKGWEHIVQTVLQRDIPTMRSLNLPARIMLHNPFGHEGYDRMRMDQFVNCQQNPATRHVADTFVDAWRPVMKEVDELILYVGFNDKISDPHKLLSTAQLARWFYPALELRASVGIDSLAVKQPAESDTQIWGLLRGEGITGYPEGLPLPNWRTTPVILQTNNDDITRLARTPREAETIIFDPEMTVADARLLQRLGYTPCVPLHNWIDAKHDLSSLARKAAA